MGSILIWNAITATAMAIGVKAATLHPWLKAKPSVVHALWWLVLLKLVAPAWLVLPILPHGDRPSVERPTADRVLAVRQQIATSAQPSGIVDQRARVGHAPGSGKDLDRREEPVRELGIPAASAESRSYLWRAWAWVALWASGTMALAGIWIRRLRLARRIMRYSEPDQTLSDAARRMARAMGLTRAPLVHRVEADLSPALLGWWTPTIILPRLAAERLGPDAVHCAIAHEVAHYGRRDHWWAALAAAMRAVFWWHPVAWWACRELRGAQEMCCDAMVLSGTSGSPQRYGRALWAWVNRPKTKPSTQIEPTVGLGTRPAIRLLKRRLVMIGDPRISHRTGRGGWCLIIGMLAGSICFPAIGRSQVSERQREREADAERREGILGALDLPMVAEGFGGEVTVSGHLISGVGIIRRYVEQTVYLETGDYIRIHEDTRIMVLAEGEIRPLDESVLLPGVAVTYSIDASAGPFVQRLTVIGIAEAPVAPPDAFEQVGERGLEALGHTQTSLDGRFPIEVEGKDGPVQVAIGETRLIELPGPTLSVLWSHGPYRPDGVEDFEAFDHLLIEWHENGRFRATCYRRVADRSSAVR